MAMALEGSFNGPLASQSQRATSANTSRSKYSAEIQYKGSCGWAIPFIHHFKTAQI